MKEQSAPMQDEEARAAQLAADRLQADAPLPGADLRHYGNDGLRQSALAAAKLGNTARAAGDVGLTVDEWGKLRHELKRSPTREDVRRAS